jgi:hypothetical protein
MSVAMQIQRGATNDWQAVRDLIARFGGRKDDIRDDDVFVFDDGSRCRVRCLSFVAGKLSHRQERERPVVEVEPQIPALFTGDALQAIARLQFKAAVTMPQIPHEYTCRLRAANDNDYVALYDAIMASPIIAAWQGTRGNVTNQKPLRYLHAGGYWYWSMSSRRTVPPFEQGRHPLWLSHHINRCTDQDWAATHMTIIGECNADT